MKVIYLGCYDVRLFGKEKACHGCLADSSTVPPCYMLIGKQAEATQTKVDGFFTIGSEIIASPNEVIILTPLQELAMELEE